MKYLIDTNILVRLANVQDPLHGTATAAVSQIQSGPNDVYLVPQVLYEFWVVATRPLPSNGLGESPANVDLLIRRWCKLLTLLRNKTGVYPRWRDLVRRYTVSGRPAHDARLVAAMLRHRIDHLLTFNDSDFKRFAEITVVTPQSLLKP